MALAECLQVAKEIHNRIGRTISVDDLSSLLGNSPQSSSFIRKARAMKVFGLLEWLDPEGYRLTRLAIRIVSPDSTLEEAQARVEAFKNVEAFARIHDLYKGKLCPEEPLLADIIVREAHVKEEFKFQWSSAFIDSGQTAGLISEQGGRLIVKTDPHDTVQADYDFKGVNTMEATREGLESTGTGTARLIFPFRGKGEAKIFFPENLSEDELEQLIALLRAYMSQSKEKTS